MQHLEYIWTRLMEEEPLFKYMFYQVKSSQQPFFVMPTIQAEV